MHHRCLGTVIEKFLIREVGFNDVTDHCLEQKKKVDSIMKDLKNYHSKRFSWNINNKEMIEVYMTKND